MNCRENEIEWCRKREDAEIHTFRIAQMERFDNLDDVKQLPREELVRARSMTPSQRLALAIDLFETGCEMMEAGLRSQHPHAAPGEIESMLRHRLRQSRMRKVSA